MRLILGMIESRIHHPYLLVNIGPVPFLFPLSFFAGPQSDFDYLIGGNSRVRQAARKLLPRGAAGGEIGSGGETGIDIFNENKVLLDQSKPHIIFTPKTTR